MAVAPAMDVEPAQWNETLALLQDSGRATRTAFYTSTMAALKRKSDELDRQIEELHEAEGRLLQMARSAAVPAPGAPFKEATEKNVDWARELVRTVNEQVQREAVVEAATEGPWQVHKLADEASQEATRALESQRKTQAEADAKVQAAALEVSRHQAQVAEEAEAAAKMALLAQGFNSHRLPLRPGIAPCGFFMRKGVCKNGKPCVWDHPEPDLNSKGYPLRPGQHTCAYYRRSKTCKLGALCMYDHPEAVNPVDTQDQLSALPPALAASAAKQQQTQLMLHLQLLQELSSLQDTDAMMSSWRKFRVTFCFNG